MWRERHRNATIATALLASFSFGFEYAAAADVKPFRMIVGEPRSMDPNLEPTTRFTLTRSSSSRWQELTTRARSPCSAARASRSARIDELGRSA